ncbi:MAG: extensin family protein [Zymomonas mobilis subsp. pomaceae]|uniref:Extensin family protein n=1 Tax=Zymomonas mobilis subsp. pomaceae (strain ATCC 29192 / DSM 22645 / JCM 10191 / CCUG 17912 / NBRC 13757 / NCIMB 11200 / NRRL B-4491 / Barker I) TaxID=579138 RepID=F8EVI7_ZYMMT|nr:extensin family protein [Zymomonas mobilis]AEI38324.1 Extensin family protein [Zymomonas mobilis subsp. pomaceae ATCC 29192]MDX5948013.1 extensin family protein [Zymomonas mobilis subsp. pomaceae]GEB89343.1 hypothetical protein ZMO02_09800 [Zymomonas mobilis subsp. pomaceae]
MSYSRFILCFAFFILASCSGSSSDKRKTANHASKYVNTPVSSESFSQCLKTLNREGVHYQLAPERQFNNGCYIHQAVVISAAQIPITHLGPLQCHAAEALAFWVDDAVQKSAKVWLGSAVIKVETFGSYNCRTRNSQSGAKISEHAHANAVDIAAFDLANGRRITIKNDWHEGDHQTKDFLHAVFRAACRRFSGVISPDGDNYHQDHLHMDLGASHYCH